MPTNGVGRARGVPRGNFVPPAVILDGRLFGTRGWIIKNVSEGWTENGVAFWLGKHVEVRRKAVHKSLSYYDIADLVTSVVAAKALRKCKLRPSVSRVLQGSGSINEKLLEFVAQSD